MRSLFKKLLCFTVALTGAGLFGSVQTRLMPAVFQKNTIHLAEGAPAAMNLKALKSKPSTRGTLIMELPPEITLVSSAYIFNRSGNHTAQDKITKEKITRSGKDYIRYTIALSRRFLSSTTRSWSWEFKTLSFLVAPGNAGKKLTFYYKVKLDKSESPETAVTVTVMPPLKKPAGKTPYFTLGHHGLFAVYTAPEKMQKKFLDLWRGLTARPVYFGARPPYQDSLKKYSGYEAVWTMFTQGTAPTFDYRGYAWMKPYPTAKGGTPSPAYLAEGAEGKLVEYVTWCMRRYRKEMPHINKIFWNIEPTQDRFGDYDLKAFAKKMKLAKVPTAAEVIRLYPKQWNRFRVECTMKVVKIVTDVMKKEFPELTVTLCGIPLSLRYPDGLNPHSAFDLRIADKFPGVDVHIPMQYYCGVELFDDVEFTLKNTKKPLIALQDFNEGSQHWYDLYTPPQVLQNIVLYAMLGARGYHCYPRDNYDHRYVQTIYDAYGIVACADKIWRKGKDISKSCKVEIVSSIPVRFRSADGKWQQVDLNSGAAQFRSRVHRLGKETAVSLFNFDTKRPCFVKVTVPEIAPDAQVTLAPDTRLILNGKTVTGKDLSSGLLLKLPPAGVTVLVAGGKEAAAGSLDISGYAQELNTLIGQLKKETSGKFTAQNAGECASDWIPHEGKFYLRLIAGKDKKVWFDINTATAVSWQNPMRWGKPYIVRYVANYLQNSKARGFAGAIEFVSQDGRRKINNFTLDSVKTEPLYNEAVFSAQVPRYQGIEQWNDPLEGLRFTVRYLQNDTGFNLVQKITLKNLNPRKEPIKGALYLRNYGIIGKVPLLAEMSDARRFFDDENAVLVKKNAKARPAKATYSGWIGDQVSVITPPNGRNRGFYSCIPDPFCSGVFTWTDGKNGRTIEFFTPEFVLAPGEEKEFVFLHCAGIIIPQDKTYQELKRSK